MYAARALNAHGTTALPSVTGILRRLFLTAPLVFSVGLSFGAAPYSGDDADLGVTRVDGLVDTYTGNAAFTTRDIVVAGATGRYGLSWQRYATSRTSQGEYYFGQAHNWTHAWQWQLSEREADANGRAVLLVREPRGSTYQFIEISPGVWRAAPAVRSELTSTETGYELKLANGCAVSFARTAGGDQTRFEARDVADIDGNHWSLDWTDGRLTQITEPAGRWLRISYASLANPQGVSSIVISAVASSDEQTTTYDYSYPAGTTQPALTAVHYPDGTTANYSYSAPRPGDRLLLVQADDPRADASIRGLVFHYQTEAGAASGQIAEIRHAADNTLHFALSAPTDSAADLRTYTVTLENGATVQRSFYPGGNLREEIDSLGFATTWTYSANGHGLETSTTDSLGHTTRFERDAHGFVARTVHPDGSSRTWQRDDRGRVLAQVDELGQTRRFSYDPSGRRTAVIHPDGTTETMAYNTLGQVTERTDRAGATTRMTYNQRGLLVSMKDAAGGSTRFTHDEHDRIASATDAGGNTTRYERDAAGRLTRTTFADGAVNAVEFDRFGKVVHTVDAEGLEHHIDYDRRGRPVSFTDPVGHVSHLDYAPAGSAAEISRPTRATLPSGRSVALAYDTRGRVTARTNAAGTRSSATTRLAYDAIGHLISSTNPAGKTVKFVYDVRGRRIQTTSALQNVTACTYDDAGRKTSETDAKGNTTRWTYDAMGRELTRTDASGNVTQRAYDAAGRLIRLTDAKGNTYGYAYDAAGRQTALTYPDGSRETTTYDAVGLKSTFTNRSGAVQSFTYDARNRETSSTWSDGSQTVVKSYDKAGRLLSEDNGVSLVTYTYDAAGRLASETQDLSPVVTAGAWDPQARTVSYTYTADDQRATLGYPSGVAITSDYDEQGRLASLRSDDSSIAIAAYEYDAAGNAIRMPRANATTTEREYDAENRTTSITDRPASNRARRSLSELDYLYDALGNRTTTVTNLPGGSQDAPAETIDSYRYDETGQLIATDYAAPVRGRRVGAPADTVRFAYDPVGNRIRVDRSGASTAYTVNALNQYEHVGSVAPTHDANGNLTAFAARTFRYDALNRLVEASDGEVIARFWYDARNRCVARMYSSVGDSSPPTLTLNTYDGWNLIEERDGNDTIQARYLHGRRVDEIVQIVNRRGTFYPHHDVLGNVTLLTDASGRLAERYAYDVNGAVSIFGPQGQALATSACDNRWMFTGREWLPEVGLYDYRNRVYSPQLGRFLQTDPIRFRAGDINIYRYVQNNPLNFIDPNGEEWLRQEGEDYVLGRDGSIIPPGGVVGAFLEDYGPAMHTFAENHDAFVGYTTTELGLPDFVVNIPSMPVVYVVSVFEEIVNTIGDFFSWVESWFE